MSRKRVTPVDRNNGYHRKEGACVNRRRNNGPEIFGKDEEGNIMHNRRNRMENDEQKPCKAHPDLRTKDQETDDHEEMDFMDFLEKKIDEESARYGIVIGDVFKLLTLASAILPNMSLETDIMHLDVSDDGIFVEIIRPDAGGQDSGDVDDPDNLYDPEDDCQDCDRYDPLAALFDMDDEEEEEHCYDDGD